MCEPNDIDSYAAHQAVSVRAAAVAGGGFAVPGCAGFVNSCAASYGQEPGRALPGFCADFKQQIFLMQAACFAEVVIIVSFQRSQLVLMAELLIWGGCVILCARSCRLQDGPVTSLCGVMRKTALIHVECVGSLFK